MVKFPEKLKAEKFTAWKIVEKNFTINKHLLPSAPYSAITGGEIIRGRRTLPLVREHQTASLLIKAHEDAWTSEHLYGLVDLHDAAFEL